MTIAEVSRQYGISADTLRYYERIGLIPPVPRNKGGIRDYDQESCGWIELMKCMRSAGVQIEALIKYVDLFQQGDATLDARKAQDPCRYSGAYVGTHNNINSLTQCHKAGVYKAHHHHRCGR